MEELEKFRKTFSETKSSKELMIEELGKELEDFKIIQKNTLNSLDTVKNEIDDMDHDLQTARQKIYQLEASKKANEEVNMGLYTQDAPIKVVVDEAVELAKKYSTEDSSSFINGILAKVIVENGLKG